MCWRSVTPAVKNSSLSSAAWVPDRSIVLIAGGWGGLGGRLRPRRRRSQAGRDDGGVGRPALHFDQIEIARRQAGRMAQDRSGDIDGVAREPQDHGAGGGRIARQPLRHRGTGRHVGRIDQPQRQLGVVALVVRRMGRLLQIEVGQHAQQGRADVETVPLTMIEQALQAGKCRRRFGHGPQRAESHT
jgi:hypothetical protein